MRITENRLRRIIHQVITESLGSSMECEGKLTTRQFSGRLRKGKYDEYDALTQFPCSELPSGWLRVMDERGIKEGQDFRLEDGQVILMPGGQISCVGDLHGELAEAIDNGQWEGMPDDGVDYDYPEGGFPKEGY